MPPIPAVTSAPVINWDPYAIQFGESQGIRWYGLAYLLGFVAAIFLLNWFSRRGLNRLQPQQNTDFVVLVAMLGVMLGGRLGYAIFYDQTLFQFGDKFPYWNLLRIWDGGMASHGGILGVMAVVFWYGWKRRIPAVHLGDNLVTAAPLGLAFGRFANFINGELYGRPAGVPWACKFPAALAEEARHDPDAARRLVNLVDQAAANGHEIFAVGPRLTLEDALANYPQLVETQRHEASLTPLFEQALLPRHPSQLYEMIFEGLLLFVILLTVRLKGGAKLPYGILTGLFFALYAIARIIIEQFRVPDASLILGLTRGQFYSAFMLLIAVGFWVYAAKRGRILAASASSQAQSENPSLANP